MSLDSYLRAAPKAELHVHLEGTIAPATALDLAARNGLTLPATDEAGMRALFAYRDFNHFLDTFSLVANCLRTAEDYEQIVCDYAAALARQNARYAEANFAPARHADNGVPHEVWFGGLTRGRARARAEFGVEINWIFSIIRHLPDRDRHADYTTAVAIEGRADGVVALGLAGGEEGHPPEPFAPWFDRARAAGLHSAPHAGETVGPTSIWGAVRALGAERIAHGVRAIEDPSLVAHLATQQIALDIVPYSNLRLGIYPSLAAHPLPRLHAAGVPLTVGSDDPPLFDTTLNDDTALLAEPFGLDRAACDTILLDGIRHSFLPAARRQALEATFRAELTTLAATHLAD